MKDKQEDKEQDGLATVPARRTLTIDVEKYQKLLDESDMSPAEKEVWVRALWNLVCAFVDFGYDLNPVQKFSGEAIAKSHARALAAAEVLSSKKPSKKAGSATLSKVSEERIPR